MAKVGRKTKFTPELKDKLLSILRGGAYQLTACDYVGISHTLYWSWLDKGHQALTKKRKTKEDIEFLEFLEGVKKARAEAELRNINIIQKAAQGGEQVKSKEIFDKDGKLVAIEYEIMPPNWTAAMTWLERSYPQRWGRKDFVEENIYHSLKVEAKQTREVKISIHERTARILGILAEVGAIPPGTDKGDNSEADEVHHSQTNGETNGVPTTES